MSIVNRYTLISSDCHAAPPMPEYRRYVEARHRAAFDDWIQLAEKRAAATRRERIGGELFDEDFVEETRKEEPIASGGMRGAWDHERRVRELESDGVAAEVIFTNGVPFAGTDGGRVDPELQLEGTRAYNRWLADLCSLAPGRRAGVAVLQLDDLESAVAEIHRAREMGLFGGIVLPAAGPGVSKIPYYNHPRYEPIWAVCEDLEMPVHTHGGVGTPSYGELPGSLGVYLTEVTFWAHRPLWFLLWSGVFERHPRLRFVLTEQTIDWIPSNLEFMDYLYSGPLFAQIRAELGRRPSEYFARQCWAGASFMTRTECEQRHSIGVDRIMFGTDYPHVEGTWPHTASRLRHTFAGLPEREVRPLLGENAARCYGFDLEQLAPIAQRIGPEVEDLMDGPNDEDLARDGTAYLLR